MISREARLRGSILFILICLATVRSAQAQYMGVGVTGAIGVLHTESHGNGMTLGGGVVFSAPYLALSLTPLDLGIMSEDPNGRYRSETFSNGTTVCRDHATGQFASKSLCGPRTIFAASADILGAVPIGSNYSFGVGGGYRLGNSRGPYGAASLYIGSLVGNSWEIRARVAQKFYDLVVSGTFRLN